MTIPALMSGVKYEQSFPDDTTADGDIIAVPIRTRISNLGILIFWSDDPGDYSYEIAVSADGVNFVILDTITQNDDFPDTRTIINWTWPFVRVNLASIENDVETTVQFIYA